MDFYFFFYHILFFISILTNIKQNANKTVLFALIAKVCSNKESIKYSIFSNCCIVMYPAAPI